MDLIQLIEQVKKCKQCVKALSHAPNPVLRVASPLARLLIIGQAPGRKVHTTHIPWNDPSGDRLRAWLDMTPDVFYDEHKIAIMPMGFCYPGKGKSGDLPPRPECAPLWHDKIRQSLPHIKLTLLIGQYAHQYYLREKRQKTLTDTVRAWEQYVEAGYLPLVHPSPRNNLWLARNPWFEKEVVPFLQARVKSLLP